MTVIAYRDGVLAADNLVWNEEGIITGTANKIHRLLGGGLIASCGAASSIIIVLKWIEKGAGEEYKPKLENNFQSLWVKPGGKIVRFDHYLVDLWTIAPFFSMGCKDSFTLGALHAGASAEEAVRLTLMHTDAGGGFLGPCVQVERL